EGGAERTTRPEGDLTPFRPPVRRGPAYSVLRSCGVTSCMLRTALLRYFVLPPAHDPAGVSVPDARHELRLADLNHADRALLRIREGVGDERVDTLTARALFEHHLEDRAAARRDHPGLHAVQHVLRVAVR